MTRETNFDIFASAIYASEEAHAKLIFEQRPEMPHREHSLRPLAEHTLAIAE